SLLAIPSPGCGGSIATAFHRRTLRTKSLEPARILWCAKQVGVSSWTLCDAIGSRVSMRQITTVAPVATELRLSREVFRKQHVPPFRAPSGNTMGGDHEATRVCRDCGCSSCYVCVQFR